LKNPPYSYILLAARTVKLSILFCYRSSVQIGYHFLQGSHRASVRAALKRKLMLGIATTIISRIIKGQEQTTFEFVKHLKNMCEATWKR
jgi:hypothetical protein